MVLTLALAEFPYKRLYDSLPSPKYLLVTAQGTLATLTGAVTSNYNVDHIVEMETIVEYFTADWASTLGLSINQWDVVYGLFESQGITPILGVSHSSQSHYHQLFKAFANI